MPCVLLDWVEYLQEVEKVLHNRCSLLAAKGRDIGGSRLFL